MIWYDPRACIPRTVFPTSRGYIRPLRPLRSSGVIKVAACGARCRHALVRAQGVHCTQGFADGSWLHQSPQAIMLFWFYRVC